MLLTVFNTAQKKLKATLKKAKTIENIPYICYLLVSVMTIIKFTLTSKAYSFTKSPYIKEWFLIATQKCPIQTYLGHSPTQPY